MSNADETLPGEETEPSARAEVEVIERGQTIGRYVVLGRVGAGAMGVVLAAYDPELDRRVAIKLLKARSGRAGDTDRSRLQREAQALARLSHRNVVTVFDVGLHDGHVYVAMEYVDGETLGAWAGTVHSWRDVVEVYIQAGRGLAAAHEAGLVHRDFKPDNVMIDGRGLVRVMDFGLARGQDEADDGGSRVERVEDTHATPGHDALATPLTRTGAMMGTPAYMSPEQFAGLGSGPPSDQFSYCVALYEALYGERPFGGDTVAALSMAVARGKVREPPRGVDVPRWVRNIVVRGLSPEPEQRWPTVRALIEALADDPATRRNRRLAIGGVVALFAATLGGVWYEASTRTEDCDAAVATIDRTWNDEHRAAVRSALQSALPAAARDTSAEIIAALDAYTGSWKDLRRKICGSGNAPGDDDRNRLAMMCLERRHATLTATVAVLEDADATVAERGERVLEHMQDMDACLDIERLRREPPPPRDAATLARLVKLESGLESVKALRSAQHQPEALEQLEALMTEAEDFEYAPFRARALQERRDLEFAVGRAQESWETGKLAYEVAVMEGMHDVAADVASSAASVLSRREESMEAARSWAVVATAHGKASGDPEIMGMVLNAISGSIPEERAEEHRKLVVARHEEIYGADSPKLIHPLFNLGFYLLRKDRVDEAERVLLRARDLAEANFGKGHVRVAPAINNLALVAGHRGDLDRQEALYREALQISEEHYGPESHRLCIYFANIGDLLEIRDDYQQAFDLNARCVASTVKSHAPTFNRLLDARLRVAHAARRLGNPARAIVELEAILDAMPRLRIADSGFALVARSDLASLLVATGRIEEGLAMLEQAEADAPRAGEDSRRYVQSRRAEVLATLPPDRGGDLSEATRIMLEARRGYALADGDPAYLKDMDDWLRERDIPVPD